MTNYYFDSSALVKFYMIEPGTVWTRQIINETNSAGKPFHHILTSALTQVEVPAAIAIIRRNRLIGERLKRQIFERFSIDAASRYSFIQLEQPLIRRAAHLTQTHGLRAYDAIHLSTAIMLKAEFELNGLSLTFVSGDNKLLKAAIREKFSTDNPFDHQDMDR